MIATALAIQDATGDAVVDISSMLLAKNIYQNYSTMTDEEMKEALWQYSTHIASLTATLVTSACLTKEQMDVMLETIREMESMGKDVQ